MNQRDLWLGVGIGSVAAALFDPNTGRRRRAWVGDKARWIARKTREGTGATARDARNRAAGLAATALGGSTAPVDDTKLHARVRSALGRVTSHPRAIHAEVWDGVVTLTGDVLEDERDTVVSTARSVPGVRDVRDELQTYAEPAHVPSLQGTGRVVTWRDSLRPRRWAPTTRAGMVACLVACGVTAYAVARARSR